MKGKVTGLFLQPKWKLGPELTLEVSPELALEVGPELTLEVSLEIVPEPIVKVIPMVTYETYALSPQ